MSIPEIKVLPDAAGIAREAAERIVVSARHAIDARGEFSIGLSGGSTPKALYELLAGPYYRPQIDWPRVLIFFGDERCVPPNHPESNYRMANEALLSRVPVPGDNIYRIRGEIDAQDAAKEYELVLQEKFGPNGGLDVNLLGMGQDGHTASLFPGTDAVNEREHLVAANYAEHSTTGRSWRVTMTLPFLNRAHHTLILVAGPDKAARVAEVLEGPRDPQRLPIQLIDPPNGQVSWLLDVAAAAMDVKETEDDRDVKG
jgi:6-phosphogluconolactonase